MPYAGHGSSIGRCALKGMLHMGMYQQLCTNHTQVKKKRSSHCHIILIMLFFIIVCDNSCDRLTPARMAVSVIGMHNHGHVNLEHIN